MADNTAHLVPVPDQLRAWARDIYDRQGARAAAQLLGLSRHTLASVLAGLPVTAGTHALVELAHYRRREAA